MAIISRNEGDIVIAGFEQARMLDEAVINEVADKLTALVDENVGGKLLLDFNNVTFMSSSMLGKVVFLAKDCKTKKVDLRLCSINANIMEAISLLRLDTMLKIYDTAGDAIEAFEAS